MRYIKRTILLVLLLIIAFCGAAASAAEISKDSKTDKVNIGSILESPDKFVGKNVTVTGKITSECGSGCWFIINDNTGDIYVTIRANNFVIPQSVGKEATVTGLLEKKDEVIITGSRVIIGDKQYP